MADREDTDPTPLIRGKTEPGVGSAVPSSGRLRAAPSADLPLQSAVGVDGGAVDFDALHAALGANAEASGRRLPSPGDDETEDDASAAETNGRSSARYSSSRPHTIPPTRAPADIDPSVPAVIVEAETDPGLTPEATAPLGAAPFVAAPTSSGRYAAAAPSASYAYTPPGAFVPQAPPPQQHTLVMPQRPQSPQIPQSPQWPQRPRSVTIVVRRRGPSALQKLGAFAAVLLLVTTCGLAVIVWRKPEWLGFVAAPIASTAEPPALPAPNVEGARTESAGTVAPAVAASVAPPGPAAPSWSAAPPPPPSPPRKSARPAHSRAP